MTHFVEFTGAPVAYAFGHAIPAGTYGQQCGEYSGLVLVRVTARDGAAQIVRVPPAAIRPANPSAIVRCEVSWLGNQSGERLTMGDGSIWFHPYSGGAPIRERQA